MHSFSLLGDIYITLSHVHVLWLGYFKCIKKKKACLILLVLHLEMSLLMIYPSCLFAYDMRIIHVVLGPKFFYVIS